jgi:fructose-specific phosphotransferase system IIC component
MLNLLIDLVLLGIVLGGLYAVYLIPPVKKAVRELAYRYRDFLFTVGFALFVAAVMYFIVLPRM